MELLKYEFNAIHGCEVQVVVENERNNERNKVLAVLDQLSHLVTLERSKIVTSCHKCHTLSAR